MKYNKRLFANLYYGNDKPFHEVADILRQPVSTLYYAVIGDGFVLRDYREADLVAMKKGRWQHPNPPRKVDWKKFEELYYEKDMLLDEIAPKFEYSSGQALGRRARKEGYKLRKIGPRKKKS